MSTMDLYSVTALLKSKGMKLESIILCDTLALRRAHLCVAETRLKRNTVVTNR